MMMNEARANSDPQLATLTNERDDSSLEGVAAPVKLLLKLIQDHKDACDKGKNDSRRMLRVATMMTILDTVRIRIQKCQSFGNKQKAGLRRCNTDLRLNPQPKEKKAGAEAAADDKERLRRELSSCTAARKRLEMMCSSLGKEKEIMAVELSRRAQEVCGMEELVNDLKAQNEKLVKKVQKFSTTSNRVEGESEGIIALQEQNKLLNEMLMRSHNGYQSMKKKLGEVERENLVVCATLGEMREKIETSSRRLRRFKDRIALSEGSMPPGVDVGEDMEALESMFEEFRMMAAKHEKRRG